MRELKRGLLRLGSTKAYAKYIMPSVISSFHRAYPNIKIKLDEGNSMDMINSLMKYHNEVVVVAAVGSKRPHIRYFPLSREEIVIILALNHPLARKKQVDFQEIKNEPVILKGSGSGTRLKINELYEIHDCRPNIFMETNNTDFIIDLVTRGEAISFLVRASVDKLIKTDQLAAVTLKNQPLLLNVNFAYLKNSPLSPPANAFYEFVKKTFMPDAIKGDTSSLMARILAGHKQNY